MKNIFRAVKKVIDTIGWQEYDKAVKYRPMAYIITEHIDGGQLVYNVLTRELVFLEPGESLCSSERYMAEHWFLVPDGLDDKSICYMYKRAYRNKYKKKDMGGILAYHIMTTSACNARCWYCYESGREQRDMSESTAGDVVRYIQKTRSGKPYLHWFGGEPLYNSGAIDSICLGLKDAGVNYSSSMTSNGYLLDEHSIDKMQTLWHLERVQVSLDGTADIYNRSKGYIYGGDAFTRVMDNIGYILGGGINVSIRLNLTPGNLEDMYGLVDTLQERFLGKGSIMVYAHPVRCASGGYAARDGEEMEALYKGYSDIQAYIRESGLGKCYNLQQDRVTNCMSDSLNSVLVTPDGKLTLCEHHTDDEYIGDIYSRQADGETVESWMEMVHTEACGQCVLSPQCMKIKKCVSSDCKKADRDYLEGEIRASMRAAYRREDYAV